MRKVVALVTLEMPPAKEDTEDGIRKKTILTGTRFSLAHDVARELVEAGACAYDEEDDDGVVAPRDRDSLNQAIGQAMRAVDPAEGLTQDGKVSIYALAHVLGYPVSIEDRDAAHEIYASKRPDLFGEQPPKEEAEQLQAVVEAIKSLDPENKSFWTQSGAPDLRVLKERLGRAVSAEERDAAMAIIEDDADA